MIDIPVKKVMIPIARYVTVKKADALNDVLQALENSKGSNSEHAHRDAIVVDENDIFLGKITMLDIFRALEPNYKKVQQESTKGALTQDFVMKAVKEFNLWLEPMQDICGRGAHKTVSEVMHVPEKAEFIKEEENIELALHKYVMGVHQPLIVKKGDTVTGILRFGDVFEVIRQGILNCPRQRR